MNDNARQNLPDDISALKEMVLQQTAVIGELQKTLNREKLLSEKLQHQLELLLKRLYGPRSDRIDMGDLPLFDAKTIQALLNPPTSAPASIPEETASDSSISRPGHGRNPLPAHLKRIEVLHDVEPEDKICGTCGTDKVKIGEENADQLEYVPATVVVLQHVRPTYACPNECEGEVVTADVPFKPIPKGLPGPGLLAKVAVNKYADHLPLYRQEEIFQRERIEIARSTMCDWMASCAEIGRPLVKRMIDLILKSHVIHTDDTPVPVLDDMKNKTKTGRLWAYLGDDAHPYNVYDYTASRRRDGPVMFLQDYLEYLQADAYRGYDGIYKPDGITEVACWAHARRKFVESQSTALETAVEAVAFIRRLYDVEDDAKNEIKSLPPDLTAEERITHSAEIRLRLRQQRSVLVLGEFKKWLEARAMDTLPKSPLGVAVSYALNNWKALNIYTADGSLAIDNNAAERAMRPVAIGRKNYIFFGSDRGGETAAILYSLIGSAKRHGLNVFEYLRDVFARFLSTPISRIDDFLPDRWKERRQSLPVPVSQA
jgi:transposase